MDIGATSLCNHSHDSQFPSLSHFPHFAPDLTGAEGFQGPLKSAQLPVIVVNKKLELLIKHHQALGYLFRLFSHPTSLLTQHQPDWLSLLGSLETLPLIWSGHSLEKVPEQVGSHSYLVLYHQILFVALVTTR